MRFCSFSSAGFKVLPSIRRGVCTCMYSVCGEEQHCTIFPTSPCIPPAHPHGVGKRVHSAIMQFAPLQACTSAKLQNLCGFLGRRGEQGTLLGACQAVLSCWSVHALRWIICTLYILYTLYSVQAVHTGLKMYRMYRMYRMYVHTGRTG